MNNFYLLMIVCLFVTGCGSENNDGNDRYDCGGPRKVVSKGAKSNSNSMKYYMEFEGVQGITQQRSLDWKIDQNGEDYSFTIDEHEYGIDFNDEKDRWDIFTIEDDNPKSVGSFEFFHYTVETAVDSDHCSTNGYEFEMNFEGKKETDSYMAGIV